MKYVETLGLLKMDFLALTTLTVIDHTIKRIKAEKGIELDLSSIPLDDPQVYALFSEGRTNGIFQFESNGMKAELRRLKPERFEDLIALNALYRPGPKDMIPEFVKRKQGLIKVRYPHPILEEILKETYGVIVYQEQVMQIASKMAGFSLGQADILRKAMGKKDAAVMESMSDRFVEGARRRKIPEKTAREVFKLMQQFAQYGFNKSHSTAYALLAYQTAYLKVHYPVQFMASLLSSEVGNTDKIVMYIAECKEMGIPILPPDVNESGLDFQSSGGAIRFGLLAIRNLGEAALSSILQSRQQKGRFRHLFQFCEEIDSRMLNKRTLESLIKSGALDSLGWRRSQYMELIDAAIEHGQKIRRDRESGQKGLFAAFDDGRGSIMAPEPPDIPEWSIEQRLAYEKETLGFYLSGHPLDRFSEEISRFSKTSIAELISEGKDAECKIAGIVTDFRTRRTKKNGELMAVFNLEDRTGTVETVVFPGSFAKFQPYMAAEFPVLVSGRFEFENETSYKFIASDIEPLAGIAERNAKILRVRACISNLGPSSAAQLHRLFQNHPGNTGVEVELYHPHDFRVNIQCADFVKVKSSPELIREIESICGPGSVIMIS